MTLHASLCIAITLAASLFSRVSQAAAPGSEIVPGALPLIPPRDIPEEPLPGYRLVRIPFDREFDSPVMLASIPGGQGEQVLAQQRGEIHAVHAEKAASRPFLDFRERMKGLILFEEGMHGIAFHPRFETNRLFYLSYTQNDPRRTVISEMKATEGPLPIAIPDSERVLLELPQPLADHWGGHLLFGPDGMLFIALGDGGLRDDPYALAQNPWVLHGKVLRINVNARSGALPYAIPADNPFAGQQVVRQEIYALGLRNPWGLSFDEKTGHLWLADVGQDLWEEINLIQPGSNYGWSHRDGPTKSAFHPDALIPGATVTDPVHSYTRLRGEGICIVGGHLYRGKKLAALEGAYLFADWGFGHVWALELDAEQRPLRRLILQRGPLAYKFNPTLVTADAAGEPIVLSQEGSLYRIETTSAE